MHSENMITLWTRGVAARTITLMAGQRFRRYDLAVRGKCFLEDRMLTHRRMSPTCSASCEEKWMYRVSHDYAIGAILAFSVSTDSEWIILLDLRFLDMLVTLASAVSYSPIISTISGGLQPRSMRSSSSHHPAIMRTRGILTEKCYSPARGTKIQDADCRAKYAC